MTLKGGPQQIEVKELPKHKKNADAGLKKTVFSSSILVEQEDAASFEDNEEVKSIAGPLWSVVGTKAVRGLWLRSL